MKCGYADMRVCVCGSVWVNGLSQFWVSIFHFIEERRARSCREAEERRMKGLTNNILIFSLSDFPPRSLLLINRSPPSLHAFFHFNLIPSASSSSSSRSLSLFSQYVGDVFPHIHIHIHIQPLLVANPPRSSNHDAWQALHQSSGPATPSTAVLQWTLQPGAARVASTTPPLTDAMLTPPSSSSSRLHLSSLLCLPSTPAVVPSLLS